LFDFIEVVEKAIRMNKSVLLASGTTTGAVPPSIKDRRFIEQ
jgi:hypothetical protein